MTIAINSVVFLDLDDGVAVITIDSPPVNALSSAVTQGLDAAVDKALADPAARAVVLICAGRTFSAGGDLKSAVMLDGLATFAARQAKLDGALKPMVAALHGQALGGGFEIALSFHYRVAAPGTRLGLPEVKIGLLPGGGGTQRLTRAVGARLALDLMTTGRTITAEEALPLGLIDEIAPGRESLREAAVAFARRKAAEGGPLPRIRDREQPIAADRGQPDIFTEFRAANAKRLRNLDAAEAIIQCVEAAVNAADFDAGIAEERRLINTIGGGAQNKALIHVFLAEREALKIPDIPADTPILPVAKVGVVGAGTMGRGIALSALAGGFDVVLVEQEQGALDRGAENIRGVIARDARLGRLTAEAAAERAGRLSPTLDLERLADADLIIEAVFEDMDVKQAMFRRLDAIARPGAILASNTSALNLDEIAAVTDRPGDVVGLHFFSPANIMRLLEVVRGRETSPSVLATAMQLGKRFGKTPVVSGVCFGFIGNRMLNARQTQAEPIILAGTPPFDVDRVLTTFGFPMGPYAMYDLSGLDVGASPTPSPRPMVRESLALAGRLGQKSGAGYFDYDAERRPSPSAVANAIIARVAERDGVPQRAFTHAEILERLLFPMINEGARILEEGVALRASDIDVVWTAGYGWPAYTGGPMYYAEQVGLAKVTATLERLGIAPAPLLERRAAAGTGWEA
jgi:3-hydroxyacyl-CoA dehydrogenase